MCATLHDLQPKENLKAREPIGVAHTEQPPGMQSRLEKGEGGLKKGNRRCLAKDDNSTIKRYLGVNNM